MRFGRQVAPFACRVEAELTKTKSAPGPPARCPLSHLSPRRRLGKLAEVGPSCLEKNFPNPSGRHHAEALVRMGARRGVPGVSHRPGTLARLPPSGYAYPGQWRAGPC